MTTTAGPLNATGVQGESDVKGRQAPVPGIYHGVINHVDASFDKHDAVIVDLEVLTGAPENMPQPDQRGRTLRHMMFLDKEDGSYGDQHLRFALATGLIRPGESKEPDWKAAEGRQIVFGVGKRIGTDKKTGEEKEYTNVSNYGLDVWSLGNTEVANVPKDEAAIKLMGGTSAPAAAGNQQSADPYDGI